MQPSHILILPLLNDKCNHFLKEKKKWHLKMEKLYYISEWFKIKIQDLQG